MSVRKRVEIPKKDDSVDIDALIEKGAKVKEDLSESKKWTFIRLRIESEMLKNVDEAVSRRVGITRTGWILEAIHEKLQREGKES